MIWHRTLKLLCAATIALCLVIGSVGAATGQPEKTLYACICGAFALLTLVRHED